MEDKLQNAFSVLSAAAQRSDCLVKADRKKEVASQLAALKLVKEYLEDIQNNIKKTDALIAITLDQALKLGLVHCKCGHPPNNHFDFDNKPCDCKCYKQKINLP